MSWNAYPGGSNHNTSQYPGQQHHNQYQQPPPPQQQYGQQPGGWQQPPHQPPQYGGQQNLYGGPPPPPIPPPSFQHSYGSAGYGGGYNSGPPPPQQQYGRNQGRDDYRPTPSHGDFTGPPSGPPPPQMHYNPNGGGMQGGGWQPPQQQGYGQLAGHNRYGPPPGPPPRPIPQGSQHYGPQFQNQQGRNAQPFFQYSQCTGKKKALLIGINYAGTSSELKGCINDVKNLKAFLQSRYGYRDEDMVVLTDDSRDPRAIPTRANMIQAMHWLVRGAQPNDSLFFHYSGHGGLTEDLAGDEESGFDDVIYPVDHKINGHIIDDEMHDIMIKPLPAGCRLTALYDSCHSGTALDLPYVYSTKGVVKEPNMLVEAGQGILGAGMSYMRGDIGGLMSGAMSTFKKIKNGSNAQKLSLETKTSPADVISLSGCKDDQTSADTQEAGKATGAMSYAFISALTAYPNVSFQQLLINIREELAGKYEQKPQLSSSHPMDVTLAWTC